MNKTKLTKNSHISITILMATYNGEKFLAEQLQSLENQTHQNWRLVISDDGSCDKTIDIAKEFQHQRGSDYVEIVQGPRQGFCQNFLSMICDSNVCADLYALSDQDDIWMPDKLERAIAYIKASNEPQTPIIYCGRTQIVDVNLKSIGFSPKFKLPSSFRNALVQSIAGGNTMVFNQATKDLLEKAGRQQVVSHDWWLYQIVKGSGGDVFYDLKPSILYRQHTSSAIGANTSFKARLHRAFYVLNGRYRKWNNINYIALNNVKYLLSKDNQDILNTFGIFRNARLKDRIRLLEVCGLYRQTWQGTISLWFATIMKKI